MIDSFYLNLAFAICILFANFFGLLWCIIKKNYRKKENGISLKALLCSAYLSFFLLVKKDELSITVGYLSLLSFWSLILSSLSRLIKKLIVKNFDSDSKKGGFDTERIKTPIERVLSTVKVKPLISPPLEKENNVINVSHVKNMMKRLECISLSITEKAQMEQLKLLLFDVENGKNDAETKSAVNDGLNSLLKIMSKYSI